MNIPFLSKWQMDRAIRKQRNHYEKVVKQYVDSRSMQNYLPHSPEILPYPQSGAAMRSMAFRVPVIRTVIENLATEQFRRLPVLKPRFEAKCPNCGAEYQDYIEYCENPMCTIQGFKCQRPDVSQKRIASEWEKKVNYNGRCQTVHDLAKMFSTDVHIQDNPWITVSFEYVTDNLTGEIISKKPVEFNYARPEVMRLVQDEYGRPGGKYYTCVDHRNVLKGPDQMFEPCGECGKPLHNVTAVSVDLSQPGTASVKDTIDHPYIDGEWYHDPYYTQTTSYGISNLYTLWTVGSTLSYMDELENNTFKQGKPPKSMLLFNSYNPASLKSQITDEISRAHRNRNYMPKLVFPFEGKVPAQVVNLMPTDSELDVLGRRKEIKEMVGILYGQSAMMIGDMSTGGGLNNEGMQQTTMLRRVESLNEWLENGYYRFVLDCIGATDYRFKFPPPKEEDRMAVLQRKKENMQMIGEALNRGADYHIKNEEDLEFEIIGKMGKLESGMGFKEMGGSGMDPTDWQHQDATFAFSLDTMRKFTDQILNERLVMFLTGQISWEEFVGYFLDHLTTSNARTIRQVLESIDPDMVIDDEVLRSVTLNRFVEDALADIQSEVVSQFPFNPTGKEMIDAGVEIAARLENVIRTENNNIVNVARAESYRADDPDDTIYDYDWVGPDYVPGRSTKVCDAIKREFDKVRAEKGRVSLDDAREIVSVEGGREHGDEKAFNMGRDWVPHFNCRHNLVARRNMGKAIIYVDSPDHAPPDSNVFEGPRGGYYYESGKGSDGSGDELGDDEDNLETPASGDAGTGSDFNNDGVEDKAIAIQDLKDNNVFHIKLYDPAKEEEVVGSMEEAGYEVDDEVDYVEVRQAEKVGGVGNG